MVAAPFVSYSKLTDDNSFANTSAIAFGRTKSTWSTAAIESLSNVPRNLHKGISKVVTAASRILGRWIYGERYKHPSDFSAEERLAIAIRGCRLKAA